MEQTALPSTLEGIVVHGQQLGRRLGFPTANLSLDDLLGTIPATGVYAAIATLPDGHRFKAMVNVGYRPTVDASHHSLTVEAHLCRYEGDLYGQRIRLDIMSRIRDERRMTSLEQLTAQLALDLQAVDSCISL